MSIPRSLQSLIVMLFFPLFLHSQNDSAFINQINFDPRLVMVMTQANEAIDQGDIKSYITLSDSLAQLIQNKYGDKNPVFFDWRYNTAVGNLFNGNYSKTVEIADELESLVREVVGEESEAMLNVYNLKGVNYRRQHKLDLAKDSYEKAIDIATQILSEDDPVLGSLQNNLGMIYEVKADYNQALPLYQQSIANARQVFGVEHGEYALRLANLANLYGLIGNQDSLIHLRRKVLQISEKAFGKQHPYYGRHLFSLAVDYCDFGLTTEALDMVLASKAIFASRMDTIQTEYANIEMRLAFIYHEIGKKEKAMIHMQNGLDIIRQVGNDESIIYAVFLSGMGELHWANDSLGAAASYFEQTLAILEKHDKPGSHRSLDARYHLGQIHKQKGEIALAKEYLTEMASTAASSLGEGHNFYLKAQKALTPIFEKMGQVAETRAILLKIHQLRKDHRLPRMKYHSSTEQLGLKEEIRVWNDHHESFLQRMNPSQDLIEAAFENSIISKELIRLNQQKMLRQIQASNDSELLSTYAEWQEVRKILGQQYSAPSDKRIASLDSLKAKANDLESSLSMKSSRFRSANELLNWRELQDRLKEDEALINLVQFRYVTPSGKISDSTYYLAYILSGREKKVLRIPLLEEKQLSHLRATKQLYHHSGPKSLNRLFWQKLTPHLSGVKKLFFSPAGIFHRINFSAIAIAPNRIIADEYVVRRITNLRQWHEPVSGSSAKTAVLYGGIQYNRGEQVKASVSALPSPSGSRSFLEEAALNLYRSSKQSAWPALAWTNEEVESIEEILLEAGLKVELKKDSLASEESVKTMGTPSPRILHFATHGYSFEAPKQNTENTFRASNNPLIRSGLILAGANAAWSGKPSDGKREDGILTAYEVSQMDLSDTELVVLSACDTGLGEIKGDEGVFGLQRAFKLAGVKYVIMSLWNVKDRQSMEFMTAFYQSWLENGKAIPEAFQNALGELRQKYAKPWNPFLWAGFVLLE